jgi:hypothetical protein
MTIIVVAIQSVEIGMTAQSLSGSNITVTGIEVGGDGTMPDPMGRNYLIDPGCFTKLSHQAINSTAIESVSLTAAV